jgi:hypothetical protein
MSNVVECETIGRVWCAVDGARAAVVAVVVVVVRRGGVQRSWHVGRAAEVLGVKGGSG